MRAVRGGKPTPSLQSFPDPQVLIQDYAALGTLKAVAEKHGLCEAYVAKRVPHTLKTTKVPVPDEDLHRMYFDEKKSYHEIRAETGCSMWHIQSRFKVNKWQARTQADSIMNALRREGLTDEQILATYAELRSTPATGVKHGLTAQAIEHILIKHGVPRTGNQKSLKNGGELLLADWLKDWGVEGILNWNDWGEVKFETAWHHIDLYVPSAKAFVEFYGDNYHSSDEAVERDQRKKDEFLKAFPGYQWLIVRSSDLTNKSRQAIVKEKLRLRLVEGRDMRVQDLVFSELGTGNRTYALRFLDLFHVRGRGGPAFFDRVFTISMGDVVVGVAAFGGPQASDSPYDIEFKRLALCDGLPKNTASWFIQRCVSSFPKWTSMITYVESDHQGSCFKGCNWAETGTTNKNGAFSFEDASGFTMSRRKTYRKAKADGTSMCKWAKENGWSKVKDQPKRIFTYTVR